MPEPEILSPAEVAAIEYGYAGLIPVEGKMLDGTLGNGLELLLNQDWRGTKSGISVNTRTAMEISAVMACVTVIAEDVGKMPCQMFRWDRKDKRGPGRTPRGRSQPETEHPYARLLTGFPNPDMTDQAFRECMTLFALLTGNGYAWKARDGQGLVRELWPLLPGTCIPRRDAHNWADLYYDVWFEDGTQMRVPGSEVFRITGVSWNGVTGLNRVALAREVFGLSKRLAEAQAKFYGKDMRPSGTISTENTTLKADMIDRIRSSWQKQFGPDGDGGVAVLDFGFKYEPMMISARDSDSIALWRLCVEEACRVFRVQPLKIMHATGSQSYSSVDVLNQAHLTDTLEPWLMRWEKELERDLLAEVDPDLYLRFNRNAYLRPLVKDRYAVYQQARQSNLLSVNEIRDLEEMEPLDDERANDPFAPIGTNPAPASGSRQSAVGSRESGAEADKPKKPAGDEGGKPAKRWPRLFGAAG